MIFLSLALAISMLLVSPVFAQDSTPLLAEVLEDAERLEPLETVIVAQNGEIIAERGYNGHGLDAPTNIKSASKTIISALVGIAIEKGILDGADQKIAPILRDDLPSNADARIEDITIGDLLTMRAGLEPTSGVNYGRWVASDNWVRAALSRPFVDDPGAGMLYSTGSSHLLSAILTQQTGRSTLANAREWLGVVPGFAIASWDRDPQGIYLGGNQMAMPPRSLLAFGELYRSGGLAPDGTRVISQAWIEQSWSPHTRSIRTGDSYGYGWFLRNIGGEDTRFAWGFGGQMLYIVPALDLTVVMTSDETTGAANTGHRDDLHDLLAEIIAAIRDAK
ncbi:Beta-lactamase class C-like penicillin binding protein [Devosia sp. LC5]|uniref:serine hydrolase domain-containing protein n=1 Tax=Devosia sp. LC5 TaxID=1502724 RepID=UPI0004E2B0C5|nr:serine hydrolase [Devosia sp. LC5]KFC72356.1 Beta-lactamase class C-like penicillin binding protein [Devosia sp. LC5]